MTYDEAAQALAERGGSTTVTPSANGYCMRVRVGTFGAECNFTVDETIGETFDGERQSAFVAAVEELLRRLPIPS